MLELSPDTSLIPFDMDCTDTANVIKIKESLAMGALTLFSVPFLFSSVD